MKPKSPKTCRGFAVYRRNGTAQKVFVQARPLSADQRASLAAWAFHEDSTDPRRPSHVTLPTDAITAQAKGYTVCRVRITPLR